MQGSDVGTLGGVGLLDGGLGQAPFEDLPPVNLLFDGAARDEAVHHHVPLLPDAERPVHTLAVHCTRTSAENTAS